MMKSKQSVLLRVVIVVSGMYSGLNAVVAQPYADLINVSHQQMKTPSVSDSFTHHFKNTVVNTMLPIRLDSSNMILVRLNGEWLSNEVQGGGQNGSVRLRMLMASIGWSHTFNQTWSFTALVLPKMASVTSGSRYSGDYQFGGSLLVNYRLRKNVRYKAGLYYNREPFGNFFVPLLGADIQLNSKNWIYGQLPLFFRYEHQFSNRVYSGLGLRIFGRSYRLGTDLGNNYMFLQENQFKVFTDIYLTKNLVVYGEVGRTLGYGFRMYGNGLQRDDRIFQPLPFQDITDGFFINGGISYRIRRDF